MLPILRTRNSWPGLVDELFNNDFFPKFAEWENNNLPAVNISENKDDYKIELAAPGLNKNDFKINLENDVLTISSEKEEKTEEKDEQVMRREFNYSKFSRSFTLPETVDVDKIKALFKDGVLKLVLPKMDEAKVKPAKEIKIS
jgi:HSP20 family protein